MTESEFKEKLELCNKVTDQNPVDPAWHSENASPSVRQQTVLDVQWSDCPDFVEKEVREMWQSDDRLHNDVCINKVYVDEEMLSEYPNIYYWLKHNKVPEDTSVWIHWWW